MNLNEVCAFCSYREHVNQPYGKTQRLWVCCTCGQLIVLKHGVWEWVKKSFGKWRRKK